jgi:hypothetical protein
MTDEKKQINRKTEGGELKMNEKNRTGQIRD